MERWTLFACHVFGVISEQLACVCECASLRCVAESFVGPSETSSNAGDSGAGAAWRAFGAAECSRTLRRPGFVEAAARSALDGSAWVCERLFRVAVCSCLGSACVA